MAPTPSADRVVQQRLAQVRQVDANDLIYQFDASRDYDPAPD
jgi:homoserine O-acetyltransferase/O-succinyltransferase